MTEGYEILLTKYNFINQLTILRYLLQTRYSTSQNYVCVPIRTRNGITAAYSALLLSTFVIISERIVTRRGALTRDRIAAAATQSVRLQDASLVQHVQVPVHPATD